MNGNTGALYHKKHAGTSISIVVGGVYADNAADFFFQEILFPERKIASLRISRPELKKFK